VRRDRVRLALVLNRFPYALFLIVDNDQVTVIACFPRASRDWRCWQERIVTDSSM
jgi:hypothetical protein